MEFDGIKGKPNVFIGDTVESLVDFVEIPDNENSRN